MAHAQIKRVSISVIFALLALAGCSSEGENGGGENGVGSQAGVGGSAGGGAGGASGAGAGGTDGTAGMMNVAGAGGAGAAGGEAGAGVTGGTGGVGGEAGTMMPGGAGGAGGEGGGGTGGIDTSTFLADCKQGGDQWGTPEQAGPCKSGVTTYGVKSDFGPYGVSSEYNVGAGFETDGTDDSVFCNSIFIPSFGADPVGSADLMDTHDLDFALFTVFYPGAMPEGEKFPLITWGNGTCAMPEGYGPLLRTVASHGYIVVAANSRSAGSAGQPMIKALDFMFAENEKADSKFFGKIDTDNVGAMGHSQGSGATATASSDPRIKAVILWNGGSSASKPYLAVSGDLDLGGTPAQFNNAVQAAPRPAAWLWYHQIPAEVNGSTTGELAPGHLTLMMESERVNDAAVAWWDMMLKGKEEAKAMFIGDSCTLCDPNAFPSMWMPTKTGSSATPSIEYGHNDMLN